MARLTTPRQRCRPHAAGFTFVELMMVMVLVAVLAAIALPRLAPLGTIRSDGWREETVAGLRLAQSLAVSHQRLVCADFTQLRLRLSTASARGSTTCDTPVPGPDGEVFYGTVQPAAGLIVSGWGPVLYFQPSGQSTNDAAGSVVTDRTVSVQPGTNTITVRGRSGHVE